MSKFISRTLTYSEIEVTTFNRDLRALFTIREKLSGDFSKMKPEDFLDEVREKLEGENSPVTVCDAKVVQTIKEKRIMTVEDFIKYSHVPSDEEKEALIEE